MILGKIEKSAEPPLTPLTKYTGLYKIKYNMCIQAILDSAARRQK